MDTVSQLVDSFYTRVVLRDIVGKIFPGLLVLFAISIWFYSPIDVMRTVNELTVIQWIIAIAGAWITAFPIQNIGERAWPLMGRLIYYDAIFLDADSSTDHLTGH